MPFMIGQAPVRRTLKYLEKGKIIFRENVKVFSINYNTKGEHHKGARDFVFWYFPQIQYKNPNVQCVSFKNLTPSPFIRIFDNDGKSTLIDIDSRSKEEILNHLSNFTAICQTKEEINENIKMSSSQLSSSCFGYGCNKHCICVVLGQVPCPSIVPVPKPWRGIPPKEPKYKIPQSFMEEGLEREEVAN